MHAISGSGHTYKQDKVPETMQSQPVAPESTAEPIAAKRRLKTWHKLLIAGGIVLLFLTCAYGFGANYWSQRFWPDTSLDGVDLSGVAFADAPAMFQDDPTEAMLVVKDADTKTEDVVTAEDIGYGTDYATPLEELQNEHNSLLWLFEVLAKKERAYTAQSSYDEKKLAALVPELKCMKAEPVKAEDARLEYLEGKFNIVEEVYGTEIEDGALKQAVLDAVAEEQPELEVTKVKDIYIQPKVKKDNPAFSEAKNKGEKMIAAEQTWKVDGTTETITSEDIAGWISLNEAGQPVLDHDAVAAWWRAMGKKYDHDANTLNNFKTSYGSVISVSGGDWQKGGRATDEAAMSAASIESIEAGEPATRDFIWSRGGSEADGELGGTYIEISISAQHVWYYVNGSLDYDYDCVTGKPDGRHNTPTGIYYIKDQATNYEMVGDDEDHDGKEDYRTTCNYWSRITWSGVGIHDLWHPYYGDDRYLSNGSHGCINSPYSAAQYIYNNVSPGTPVVIY